MAAILDVAEGSTNNFGRGSSKKYPSLGRRSNCEKIMDDGQVIGKAHLSLKYHSNINIYTSQPKCL
jgi:hypothetical protein